MDRGRRTRQGGRPTGAVGNADSVRPAAARVRSPLPADVVSSPVPHVLTRTSKKIHGWWPGKRDCTAERLLVNPYNGCSHNCSYCYAHALPGRFAMFAQHGVVTVCDGFDQEVARQLDGLRVAACGYLSPVTDPFQPVDTRYHLSLGIIRAFVTRGLPVEFTTKGRVPDEALALMASQPHCFGQVSIVTLDAVRHRILMPGAQTPDVLLDNLRRIKVAGLYAVARIDPVIPYLTDDPEELRRLVAAVRAAGADHLVTSCLDLPIGAGDRVIDELSLAVPAQGRAGWRSRFAGLYRERIGASTHAAEGYRRDLFAYLRQLAIEHQMTFALCMEYVKPPQAGMLPVGLNREYTNCRNCEGIDVPIYVRAPGEERFAPLAGCDGACLLCAPEHAAATCGVTELAGGGGWTLADYRRFSTTRYASRPML